MSNNSCRVYVRDWCAYCDAAVHFLEEKSVPHEVLKVDKEYLLEHFEADTWPQIVMWGEHIGGYEDLQKYAEETGMTSGWGS